MATATLPSSPCSPQFTITSEEISRYAELTSLLTQLEKQKDELRTELLELRADGVEQGRDRTVFAGVHRTRNDGTSTGNLRRFLSLRSCTVPKGEYLEDPD
jgi:hypothetical protein